MPVKFSRLRWSAKKFCESKSPSSVYDKYIDIPSWCKVLMLENLVRLLCRHSIYYDNLSR